MTKDAIINRSAKQQILRVELMRFELKQLGYSVVRTDRLQKMLAGQPLIERMNTMLLEAE